MMKSPFPRRKVLILTAIIPLVAGLMLSGCSGLTTSAVPAHRLWQSGDQFVGIAPHDTPGAPANEHPATIDKSIVAAALASLQLTEKDEPGATPLFTDNQLHLLGEQLHNGLARATTTEDVTFALIGNHSSYLGLAKRPKVTTGRLFYQGGALNLIVGLAHQDVNERDDRRLKPFTPGSRIEPISENEWTILPQGNSPAVTLKRSDWIVFGKELLTAPPPVIRKSPVAEPLPLTDISRPPADTRTPAERLNVINDLKDKGLISDEEYRTKRLEILNSL